MIMENRDPILCAVGQNIRKLREDKDLTQRALAQIAGLDRTYISDMERGVRNFSIQSFARIARALEVTLSKLCSGVEL